MDDSFFQQISVSSQYLVHNVKGIYLCQFFLLPHVLMQIAVRTVLENQVIKIRRLDDFMQPQHVLMDQSAVDLNFRLQHLQARPSELLQLDHLYRIAMVDPLYLHSFVHPTTVTLAQLILGRVLINANPDLCFLERVQLLQAFLLGVVARGGGLEFIVVAGDLSTVVAHCHYNSIR